MALPTPGDPLPRIAEGFVEQLKLITYILGPAGHGDDWARAFGIDRADAQRLFDLIFVACQSATVSDVRDSVSHGFTCGAEIELAIDDRRRRVRTSWHYADESARPRLVTAYPRT